MDTRPGSSATFPFARALALYAVFMAAVLAALRLTSGSSFGVMLGPIAAQAAMALVILAGSRACLGGRPSPAPSIPRRRLRCVPLVLVGLGGFVFQATVIAGARWSPASIPATGIEAPMLWIVLVLTSVVGAPVLEELFFRGMLQPLLGRRSLVVGLLATAALFGIAHGFETPFRAVPAFLHGLVLGGVTLLTGRLRAAMAVHALNNALAMLATLGLALGPALPVMESPWPGSAGLVAVSSLLGLCLLAAGFTRLARQARLDGPMRADSPIPSAVLV